MGKFVVNLDLDYFQSFTVLSHRIQIYPIAVLVGRGEAVSQTLKNE